MRLYLSFLFILFPFFTLAQSPVNISFKDWQVNCDEYNQCEATTNSSQIKNGISDYIFSLSRGEFQDYWEISLIANGSDPSENSTIKITLADEDLEFISSQNFAAYGLLNQYYFLGEKAQILFDMLMPADSAQISFDDKVANFSLSGLSASLLFIDERQDEIGTERMASEPPRNITIVTSREPDPFPDMLRREHENPTISGCEPLAELVHKDDFQSFRLDATHTLYLVPCFAGAYNFSHVAYVKGDYETKMEIFASYWEESGWSGTQYLVNSWFIEKQNIIVDFSKARGLGDCGTSGVWQWDKYSFKLLQYSAKSKCNENYDDGDEIGNFPVIYQHPDYKGREKK
jgi:hypothetical protein